MIRSMERSIFIMARRWYCLWLMTEMSAGSIRRAGRAAGLLLFAAWERKEKEEGEMPVQYQDLPRIHLMVAFRDIYREISGEYFGKCP